MVVNERVYRPVLWEMLISGVVGLFASFVLSVEAWELAKNANAQFGCDVNSVISCSTVAQAPQAQVLGFPNAFLGILFESVVLTVTVASLLHVVFPRMFMLLLQVFYSVGLGFAVWLFTQSYFVIHVLCPWCLLITVTTFFVWYGLLQVNVHLGYISVGERVEKVMVLTRWVVPFMFVFICGAMIVGKYGVALFHGLYG